MKLFSRRDQPEPEHLIYEVPERARSRILFIVKDHFEAQHAFSFRAFTEEAVKVLLKEYGSLVGFSYRAASLGDPFLDHAARCSSEQFLDIVELVFRSRGYWHDESADPSLVDELNRVFREEGIGYQLTPMTSRTVKDGGWLHGRRCDVVEYTYPAVVRADSSVLHDQVMTPALSLLADERFAVANEEFIKALRHHRHGDWDESIGCCASALESVLKTICSLKSWPYDEGDTASKLIEICIEHGLVPSFYSNCLISTATIRNKLSDAVHGKGPDGVTVSSLQVEHVLHVTATNIAFLVAVL